MHMTRRCRTGASVLACMLLAACVSVPEQAAGEYAGGSPSIGWVHGPCIALADANVAPGTGVVMVTLDEPQQAVRARIGRRAGPGDACPPLEEDRREVNVASGLSFHLIEPGAADALAIGVLVPERTQAASATPDIDRDGVPDVFDHCATSEGIRFLVRSGASATGETLWDGYYYLGYDVEPDCPDGD